MHASQLALMTARIDDLTAKLALSEKAQRQLRQRLATSRLEAGEAAALAEGERSGSCGGRCGSESVEGA
ncbi:hypothetical protein HPB48_008914 [Haemaphysalis longicornis]|uniref:Uncharacterized protein n=1 Tax=Haemaphysalis longicornis TaxID=44386 RepID=A0A9J6FGM5_HAELO|nr:hypothetical protein HPB48_008914 [Haemaphysalis longicornis]